MVFAETVTVPKATLSSAPVKRTVKLTKGLVYQFEIYFPPGPSGLVGVRVREKDTQLYPVERTEWFVGDRVSLSYTDTYYVFEPPYEWEISVYNIDDTYEHTIQVRIGLMTEEEYMARYAPLAGIESLQSSLEALADAMKAQYSVTGGSPLAVFREEEEAEGQA